MKGSLRGILLINYIWLVIVFLIIFFAAIPLIPGTVVVELPESDEWKTTITNDTVIITGNATVHNGGLWPFNNFFFALVLYDENGSSLASFSSKKTDLLPGLWMEVPMTLYINKSQMKSSLLQALLSSEVTFASLVFFNTNYLFDFQIQAGFKGNVTLGPLIKDFNLDHSRTVITTNGTSYHMEIPYSFNSSGVLQGSDLSISGTISNSTMPLGTIGTDVTLGGHVEGMLVVELTEEAFDHLATSPDHLFFEIEVKLNDVSWNVTAEHDWTPPNGGG